jgi:hypothetical protein
MVQPFDIASLELTGDPFPIAEEVIFAPRFNKGSFTISDKSELIYEKGIAADGSILSIRNRLNLEVDTLLIGDMYYSADLSPDEQRLVINSAELASNSDIWIYDFNQKIKTRFSFDSHDEAIPIWSPDETQISYSSNRNDTISDRFTQLYIKPTSGIQPESLLIEIKDASLFPLDFSANGKSLIYQKIENSKGEIWSLDLETGQTESIFDTTISVYWCKISPDGKWLAYAENKDGVSEVFVTTYPKPSGKWQASKGEGGLAQWNNNGAELFYINDNFEICSVEFDGTGNYPKTGKITTLFSVNPVNNSLVYTPLNDGQRFITFENIGIKNKNQIVFVQNYKQEFIDR